MYLVLFEIVVLALLFLSPLNLYLRGERRETTNLVLMVAMVLAAVFGFVVFGWIVGLATLVSG